MVKRKLNRDRKSRLSKRVNRHRSKITLLESSEDDIETPSTSSYNESSSLVSEMKTPQPSTSEDVEQLQTTSEVFEETDEDLREASSVLVHGKTNIIHDGFIYDRGTTKKYLKQTDLGELSVMCPHCCALLWKKESKGFCCANGKVVLPELSNPPELLMKLLRREHEKSSPFMKNVRKFNSMFAVTSIGCNEVHHGNYMPTFKIYGQLYHRIGSLLPVVGDDPKFLQIYFVGDKEAETHIRSSRFKDFDISLIQQIQDYLHLNNKYVKEFKTTCERIRNSPQIKDTKIIIRDIGIPNVHKRRTNKPTVPEVAVIMSGEHSSSRDIIIEGRDHTVRRICETRPSYDPLQYPLMFPQGDDGYQINLLHSDQKKSLSAMEYYRYRLMVRENNYLLLFGDLLNLIMCYICY